MKKKIKKWLVVLYLVVMYTLLVVVPTIYLSGVWHIQLGSITLSFDYSAIHIGLLAGLFASDLRDLIDRWLSPSEACMPFSKRKAWRWLFRLTAMAVLFLTTGVAYLVGQKYQLHAPFEYFGSLDVGDLFFFWIIYAIVTFSAIRMPQEEEEKNDAQKPKEQLEEQLE